MEKVTVIAADEFGNVIRVSANNPDYGFIRLEQNSVQIQNGWVSRKTKSAILPGLVSDLKFLAWTAGQELEGKIVVKESLDPIMKDNLDFGIKRAGENGPICVVEDQPIYRRTYYSLDLNDQDVYLQHTNVSEIRENNASKNSTPVAKAAPKKVEASVEEAVNSIQDEVAFDF